MMHKMMVGTSSYALYTMMIMHEMVVTSSYALMMMMHKRWSLRRRTR